MEHFNVTELDFQKIKDSIKDHYVSVANSKYTDWNFEGSGLNTLLDVLAYNTHYNAMVAHFALNENFLDSAQIRGNVVSHAKLLGYIPRSCAAATAKINLTVTGTINSPAIGTLERGTRFKTAVDGSTYTFVVLDPMDSTKSASNTYTFSNVEIKQGILKRMLYVVDNSIENQKFVIPDTNVDTTTLRVRVKAHQASELHTVYTEFSSLSGITGESAVYFLQENSSGNYEIYFGDNVLGKKPTSNNVVEMEYVYTDGPLANNAGIFTPLDTIVNSSTISVTLVTSATGGSDAETIDSIRFNAPFIYISQNRAVTADDYKAIIQREVGNIDAVSVWGGEDNPEPDFGKVYISVKPSNADYLTQEQKDYITGTVLKSKNMVSITPVMVDPEYTYIDLDVFFKYNPNLTDRTKIALETLVRSVVGDYADNYLKRFDGVFRYSKLLANIDACDPSMLNSSARVFMVKRITPIGETVNYFDLYCSSPIYNTTSADPILESSVFKIGGVDHILADVPITNSSDRRIYVYRYVGGVKTQLNPVGYVYPSSGRILISGITPDTSDMITISVAPNSNDLAPKRNQLLDIMTADIAITGEIDTIAVAGSVGAIGYTTPSRHRTS